MCLHPKPWLSKGLIFVSCLYGQVTTTHDTLAVIQERSTFQLSNTFVIANSVVCISHQNAIIDSVNEIKGIVYTLDSISSENKVIFTYSHLIKPLPKSVNLTIPIFDGGKNMGLKQSTIPRSTSVKNPNSVQSAGSFFRQLNMSQKGGTEFFGGMKFQLQGYINDNIQISGFISDQEFPLQPEGNTQKLGEIDQVFIRLNHPNTLMEVGDIDFTKHIGKLQHYDRKLIGIKNNFNKEDLNVESILSTTKSRFRTIELKGIDGMQGPYKLSSDNGNINIIIQGGTEKVWLNGVALVRGKNHDYVVDYQTGEISFTAKQLIHHDSDIYVEYQYNDFQYNRNLLGGSFTKNVNGKGHISVHWYKEDDFISSNRSELSSEALLSLEQSGDNEPVLNGILSDTTGNYYLSNSILIYIKDIDSTHAEDAERVSAVFHYNENGSYIKKISDTGHSYYQFSDFPAENELTYSPGQTIVRPEDLQSFTIQSDWHYENNIHLKLEFAHSNQDLNTLSALNDQDNQGFAYYFEVEKKANLSSNKPAINIRLSDWKKSKQYSSLNRDTDILFNRDWNISSEQVGEFRLQEGDVSVSLPKSGLSTIRFSSLQYGIEQKDRLLFTQQVHSPIFKGSYITLNRVKSQKHLFLQKSAYIAISPWSIQPFIQYTSELDEYIKAFETSSLGLVKKINQIEWKIKMSHRMDAVEQDSLLQGLEVYQKGWFLEGDLSSGKTQGWRKEFTLRKRIQSDKFSGRDINYTLGQVQLSFGNSRHPIQWDMQLNSEETFKENRIVVYDSIGPGLGHYRYDEYFNDYIEDEHGSYIAQTISSGRLNQSSSLSGSHRFKYDMSKEKSFWRIPLSFHLENRLDYSGNEQNIKSALIPKIENSRIIRSRWHNRIRLDYNPILSKMRIQTWGNVSRDMNGMDPRGNDIRHSSEAIILIENSRSKRWKIHNKTEWTLFDVESQISILRNREINGWWNEITLTQKVTTDTQWGLSIHGGQGSGSYGINTFTADGFGLSIEGKTFIMKKGKLESKWVWNNIQLKSGNLLPPEALRGNPVGNGYRTQTRFQWMVDRRLSLNLSLTTILDSRYGSLITFNGELRAYF